ncbi:MAG TPA: hypothetical protein VFV95_11730, partial [Vicinamibacterales bacterium]|nr:hypothetical protein [Vicinamibacterales bacterium]
AAGAVKYGEGPLAFAGATYDPTSNYRAAAVFAFHRRQGLTPERLRAMSQRQVGLLKQRFESLDIDPRVAHVEPMPDERRGGFLAIRTVRAQVLTRDLKRRGIWTDARGDILRVGPAPYVTDTQIEDAVVVLGEQLRLPG